MIVIDMLMKMIIMNKVNVAYKVVFGDSDEPRLVKI
jgi:hypothetical protein